MGYGGRIVWTSVIKNINCIEKKKIFLVFTPKFSDLIKGYYFDRSASLINDEIFKDNPRLIFNDCSKKCNITNKIDLIINKIIRLPVLNSLFETILINWSNKIGKNKDFILIHFDLNKYSLAQKIYSNRFDWVKHEHWVDYLTKFFISKSVKTKFDRKGEIYFTEVEKNNVNRILNKININSDTNYIVLNPTSKNDYFGELRNWPFSSWQELVYRINKKYEKANLIQIGLKSDKKLNGVVSLCGELTFRETVLVIKKARLYLGHEGGLMHAANIVTSKSLIIWGGVTLPEFAGYKDNSNIICQYVDCAPCGNFGWCDNNHICMEQISVEKVFKNIVSMAN